MNKSLKATSTVFSWVFVVFCWISFLAYGINIGSVLILLASILALPIKQVRNLWVKYLPHERGWLKPVGIAFVFFLAVLLVPQDASTANSNLTPDTSPTITSTEPTTDFETAVESSEVETTLTAETKDSTQLETDSNIPQETSASIATIPSSQEISLSTIPAFDNKPYIEINNNVPSFLSSELSTTSFESYSQLDSLGRCGVAYANIGIDLMPNEERGSIGQVKPTGWHTVKYDCVDGKYLYNRCHLIGFQLTGENANVNNLITGTRYMNVDGMLPFENMVADYIKETENHVLYRVTPIYEGNNLVAAGVQMEAKSVEDNGDGILFNVFVYNNQPGVTIDYATGDSHLSDNTSNNQSTVNNNTNIPPQIPETQAPAPQPEVQETFQQNTMTYVLNKSTKKFHYPSCSSIAQMKESNRGTFSGNRDELIAQGYDPCKKCNP